MHYWLLALALFSLSISPVLARLAAAPIEVICFWRLLTAGLILQLFTLARSAFGPEREAAATVPSSRGDAEISNARKWAFRTGFLFFAHLWTFVFAVQHTSVAHLVILFSANPIFTALLSRYWLRDAKMTKGLGQRIFAAYPLALLGILILMSGETATKTPQLAGDAVTLVSAFLHSMYLLASRMARLALPNLMVSKTINLVAAAFFLATSLVFGVALFPYPTQTWIAIGLLVALPSLLGHTLFTYLVNTFPVSVLSLSKLLEPASSIAMASLLLGEGITARVLIAFAVTSFGLSMLYWPERLWRRFARG